MVRDFAELARAPAEHPWQEITVHLYDDDGIASINRAIMDHDGPTDVITQRYTPIPGESAGQLANCSSMSNVRIKPRRAVRDGRPTTNSRSISHTAATI